MTNDEFKQILDEAIRPLQQSQEEFRRELNELKDTVETRVLPSLTYIETTVKSYADSYITNEDHIRRLDKRVTKVEDNLGIIPPQELTIPSVD